MTQSDDSIKDELAKIAQRLDSHDANFHNLNEHLTTHSAQSEQIQRQLNTHSQQFEKLLEVITASKQEAIDHFDVVAENLRHDLVGIHTRKIENQQTAIDNHDTRIAKLERANPLLAG